jgi:diphthamide biosynthesis protein 3
LNGELTPSDLEILADDIDYFVANIPTIAIAISKQLEHLAFILAKITTPDGTLQDGAPDISKLPTQATALQESIANQTTSIAMTRMRITELGDQIHTIYRELFEVSVRIIEQTLHGSVARGGKARAEHLASVAKGMELKLQYATILSPYFQLNSTLHPPFCDSLLAITFLFPPN